MPCGDNDDCQNQGIELSALADNDHSDHEGDTENCTPFCICTCCGQTFSGAFVSYSLSLHIPFIVENFILYNASFTSEVYLSIWQPPKIS